MFDSVRHPKDKDRMENSVNSDQTAPDSLPRPVC